jgi:eukaryotic-like serine/threonine-protein kinase
MCSNSSKSAVKVWPEFTQLTLMDHPNIAKVHDGDTTEDGRPYFVMELVKGVPLMQ